MSFRLSALFTIIVLVLAACGSTAAPTAVPTEIPPASTPELTSVSASTIPATPHAASSVPPLTPAPTPRAIAYGKSYIGVHYCTDGSTPLTMNIIAPKEQSAPAPVLVHLKYQPELLRPLVERGFVVASVDWREPPNFKLPIGVQDVKCAIRYLRANAPQYMIDPDHIGVFGCSRGGHLSAMIGVTDSDADMDGNFGFPDVSSRVQAVAMFDGIANFKTNYADAPDELNEVHGISSFDDPQIARLSPITYASPDDPPFLIIASDAEGWHAQAEELKGALEAQHVPVNYIPAEGATHCNFSVAGPHSKENMPRVIGDFFKQTLK